MLDLNNQLAICIFARVEKDLVKLGHIKIY